METRSERCSAAGFQYGGRKPQAKEWRKPPKAGKGKETDYYPRVDRKERSPTETSILAQ